MKQRITWCIIALQLCAIAWATSWMDDAHGARTLARWAVGFIVAICIVEFYRSVPTIDRTQARINRIQKWHRKARAA